jgi:uncharacterized protein
MKQTLIIFTRYPEAGKAKTRLIPILGKEGAAKLQRRLTEYTVKQAQNFRQLKEIEVIVYFTGGNINLMQDWLGNDLNYLPQVEGDLGIKMRSAFADTFQKNSERIVIIGTDCPSIDCQILASAFDALQDDDLVLGEAVDGGYYLIGLSKLFPELFSNINWGTNQVFAATQSIAKKLDLGIAYLPILRDLDRPEDLSLITLLPGQES